MPSQREELVLDALIVGAGFSGLTVLHKLRSLGFAVKIYEQGHDLGGTWFWNKYPGARVDSGVPVYQFQFGDEAEKKIWESFQWSERFPGREEIMRYFHHADKKLEFSKDTYFNTRVISAHFDDKRNQWLVKSVSEVEGEPGPPPTWATHLVLCTGALAKPFTPPFEGLDTFRGKCFHSARWPDTVDLKGKRVAIIGTGATGVQIVQEIGSEVGHLTVYQRTPNYTVPMCQRWRGTPPPGRTNNDGGKAWDFPSPDSFDTTYNYARATFGGMNYDFSPARFQDATPAEREALFEDLWKRGGLEYWLAGYMCLFFEKEANDAVYEFWAKKVRARLSDPKKQDLMAPAKPPHAWGTKRPSLEQTYYEALDQPNVDVISVKESPILRITPAGVETKQEGVIPVDVLILATGFDAQTGTILNIDIRNGAGKTMSQKWDDGVRTYLGITTAGFPNMYFFYGPQASTAFSNGPTCAQIQADWLVDLVVGMRDERKTRVEATKEAEEGWVKAVNDVWQASLLPGTESWYQGANIPGKRREPLSFLGGIPAYEKALIECAKNKYQGFVLS